jgi:hypothetical protein
MTPPPVNDGLLRTQLVARSQQLFGSIGQFQVRTRLTRDDVVDLPEVQESTRVSFSDGSRYQGMRESVEANNPGLAMYRQMAQLAESMDRLQGRRADEDALERR